MIKIKFKKLVPQAIKPSKATKGSAGFDISSAEDSEKLIIPGAMVPISTGLAVAIPEGYELQCRPRSGLAFKCRLTIINSPGTIDSDYRGEIKIGLINHGKEAFTVKPGDRIAQLVLAKVEEGDFDEVDDLDSTERGTGGFGSTGV